MHRPSLLLSICGVATAMSSSLRAVSALARPPSIMPPAMIDACKGLTEGAACQLELGGKQVQGICSPLPDESLACRPGGKRPPKKAAPAPQ